MIIGKQFKFEASHQLPDESCYGECRKLHGHRYELEVEISGDVNKKGWIMNFKDLKKIVSSLVIAKYDHSHLNDYFENPTVENISTKIFNDLKNKLEMTEIKLHKIKLWETSNSYAIVEGQ